jgi:hypothetical protein
MKIGFVTPLTGGAGFLGQEQLTWAKYAVKTLARPLGLKITLVPGDTPVEQGPAPAQALAQKFVADKSVVAILGPDVLPGRPRACLAVRDPHGPDKGHDSRGDKRVPPGGPW